LVGGLRSEMRLVAMDDWGLFTVERGESVMQGLVALR
jgi:hypothetical protein